MKKWLVALALISTPADAEYLGRMSSNQFDYDSTSNQFGPYGSPFSPQSVTNDYAINPPTLNSSDK